ncbi:hypothetical protein [Polaribacter sp.]|uniref:hypothetical protein n=1 Tax=Polaribacter sp. TaxID=1920175 RepID=UPI003F6B179C
MKEVLKVLRDLRIETSERGNYSQSYAKGYTDAISDAIQAVKKMDYIPCCKSDSELLKDKENLSFKGWMRVKGYEKNLDEPWLKDGKICTGSEIRYMLELYKAL